MAIALLWVNVAGLPAFPSRSGGQKKWPPIYERPEGEWVCGSKRASLVLGYWCFARVQRCRYERDRTRYTATGYVGYGGLERRDWSGQIRRTTSRAGASNQRWPGHSSEEPRRASSSQPNSPTCCPDLGENLL